MLLAFLNELLTNGLQLHIIQKKGRRYDDVRFLFQCCYEEVRHGYAYAYRRAYIVILF